MGARGARVESRGRGWNRGGWGQTRGRAGGGESWESWKKPRKSGNSQELGGPGQVPPSAQALSAHLILTN